MKIPTTIGMIMDGNRRFAKEQGMPLLKGHEAGKEKLREVVTWCKDAGVKNLIVYAFSTENWNRPAEEVDYLMNLIRHMMSDEIDEIIERGGRVRFVGQRERFSEDIQKIFADAEEKTKDGQVTLWLALSYGGRAEILHAVKNIAGKGLKPEEITEDTISNELWIAGMPDPDIILRTSGEKRLSGFLPWQGVYSELFFIDTYWPAFSKEEFDAILREYDERERRFGK